MTGPVSEYDVPGRDERRALAEAVRAAADELREAPDPGTLAWGADATRALADLVSAALPLWDSAMAVMALSGADWTTVGAHAGITAQQASRRAATSRELRQYATGVEGGAARVSRDAVAVARSDLQRGCLEYGALGATKTRRRPSPA